MKRVAMVLALTAALSGAACGEITGFCMTAGAPGLKLVVTKTPTGIKCSYQVPADTIPRPAPTGHAGGQARLSAALLDYIASN